MLKGKPQERLVDITPDVRLLRVLRNSGFNLQTAIGELLDNSVDAGASQIDLYIYNNNQEKTSIMLVDNGRGMSESNLQYALTLAKELKVGLDQLGKYGMGMKTAALSLSTQFKIFTKTASSRHICYGEFNINKMEQRGEYKTNVRYADAAEEEFMLKKFSRRQRSGTILIIENCDRVDVTFPTFVKQMQSFIGLTYRSYINKGLTFTVNNMPVQGEVVSMIDPLMRDNEHTYIIADRMGFPVEYKEETGKMKNTFIEISAAVLPKPDKNSKGRLVDDKEIPLALNQRNQGIYFYREGRMVGRALSWSNVFGEKHNFKNRLRIEINCKNDLDDEIKMNFQKGNVSPTNSLKNQLEQIIEPIMVEMKEKIKLEEELINEGNHTLSNPTIQSPKETESTEMVVSRKRVPSPTNRVEKAPKVRNKVARKQKEASVDELLAQAHKIGELLNSDKYSEEVKDKFRQALGQLSAVSCDCISASPFNNH